MSVVEQHTRVLAFIEQWRGHGDEKQETQRFWLDLLQNVLGVRGAINQTLFEYRTVGGGFIDVLCPEARLLVEQKSGDIDLDRPESRQGTMVTPVQQALRYADALPPSLKPAVLCTCNFNTFRFYDLEKDPRATGKPADEFTLEDLGDHLGTLTSIFSVEHSRLTVQQKLSETAGLLVANLHNALASQYADPDDPGSHHSLAVLTVRMVFCLYAEDAGLFPANAFSDLVQANDTKHLRRAIMDLFDVLDTPVPERDPYLEDELKRFPYVNGGLFAERIEVPQFTDDIRDAILRAGETFTWKDISPVIFGSLMEETLSHRERRQKGMHYTTVKNIHRLIDPLFLDELKAELKAIEDDETLGEKARSNRLTAYQDKLASLQFLDPACGSGNFLTETFLQLRELENRAIADRLHGQGYIDLGGDESLVKVRIDQMHGIEINDFAVCVAKTALWIAEQQALDDTESIAGQALPHLPLHDSGNIMCANALQIDWNTLLPADQCDYVMGNPPFVGHQYRTESQQADMDKVFAGYKSYGKLDYVCAWFVKTIQYIGTKNVHVAFVATNSICQGESVGILWKQLAQHGYCIEFARKTFTWDSQTTDQAHVHVVIVGLAYNTHARPDKPLFNGDVCKKAKHINGYLVAAPDMFVENRSHPCNAGAPVMTKGSQATDGGYLFLSENEKDSLICKYPNLAEVIKPFIGAKELLYERNRYCLWFKDVNLSNYAYPEIRERLEGVMNTRLKSPTASVRKAANTPALFTQIRQPDADYLAIPRHSKHERDYLPIVFESPDTIAGDAVSIIPTNNMTIFGLLSSSVHMIWIKTVAGRIKSDYRYSPYVYNSFVFPSNNLESIKEAALAVVKSRAIYTGKNLADMYAIKNRFFYPELMQAHRELDEQVMAGYGLRSDSNEGQIVDMLFDLYLRVTGKRGY